MKSLAVFALLFLPSATLAQTPAAAPPICDTPQSHQFDFWVGKWEVTAAGHPEVKVADSLIEKLYSGCAIRENWMPLKGPGGGSLSAYIPEKNGWRQIWVAPGDFVDFNGGWNGTTMIIQGVWPVPNHPTQLSRMTYTPNSDGSVEQKGETSDDGGATWQPGFDFIYRRPAP